LASLVTHPLLFAIAAVVLAGGGIGILFNILAPRGLFRIPGGNAGKPAVVEPAERAGKVAAPVASMASMAGHALALPAPVPRGMGANKGPVAGGKGTAVGAKYVPKAIDFEEAKAVFKQGSAVWVDARSESSYNYGHVPGAINIPSSDFDRAYARESGRLPRTGAIVVYCESSDCDQAEHVLEKLVGRGYRNLVHYRQGWTSWETAGMPQEPK
jgi:rhodanese-related sulfurtransferase